MTKLLVIADDFTGALDTGIQFVRQGVSTKIITISQNSIPSLPQPEEVLVIDTQTRHCDLGTSYQIVHTICLLAKAAGIQYFYKKTDSALRGNIGSELSGLLAASGEKFLSFVPAFPAAGRTTRNGIHFWNGKPIHTTAFGKDLLNPLSTSSIPKLLHLQTELPIQVVPIDFVSLNKDFRGILVFDGETEKHLKQIASYFRTENITTVWAGCAGFGIFLPDLLSLSKKVRTNYQKTSRLAFFCGSLHPVTQRQIAYAKEQGFVEIRLTPGQKLIPEYYTTTEGKNLLFEISQSLCRSHSIIINTFDKNNGETASYAMAHHIPQKEIPSRITSTLAVIADYFIQEEICTDFFMTGGDTLLGLMKQLHCTQMEPLWEIGLGTVISNLQSNGKKLQIISKSGGLGEPDMFVKAAKLLGVEVSSLYRPHS